MRTELLLLFLFLSFLAPHSLAFSQNGEQFNIYLLKHRFGDEGKEFIENNSIFKEIQLLGGYMIDPRKKGVIDLENVEKYLVKFYPDSTDSGILCINLENRLYHNLKSHDVNSRRYNEAVREFIILLKFIRQKRPHVKFGIYGLPFRTYYPTQYRHNKDEKLDPILSLTDYIFPSLYVLYPDKQKGVEKNNYYFTRNLDTAFDYAERLQKPVIPFIWYVVNVGNKQYGGELLGKEEFKRYIDFIKDYRSKNNNKVKGVVWWESSQAAFNREVRQASHLKNQKIKLDNYTILREYTKHLFCNR